MLAYDMADHGNTLVHEAHRLMLASAIVYLRFKDMASLTGEGRKVIARLRPHLCFKTSVMAAESS